MLRWKHEFSNTSQLDCQFYYSKQEIKESRDTFIETDEYEIAAQHTFSLGSINQIIWGGNYRTTEADTMPFNSGSDDDTLVGLFAQDEITILDTLRLVAGLKYEHSTFTGSDYSPRGSLLYSPHPDHHLRFSVSRAHTLPSFLENSLNIKFSPSLGFLSLLLPKGNKHLDTEKITAYELGYRTTLFNRAGLNVELYYNDLKDAILVTPVRKGLPFPLIFDNGFDAISKGVEVSVDLPLTSWWKLSANYTFQEVKKRDEHTDMYGIPKHKFNIWSSFTFRNGFSLDLMAYYVDDTKWDGLIEDVKIDDYLRFDVRIAQKLYNDRLELAFVGQNLTDKLHPESADGAGTYEVERLLYGQITYKY